MFRFPITSCVSKNDHQDPKRGGHFYLLRIQPAIKTWQTFPTSSKTEREVLAIHTLLRLMTMAAPPLENSSALGCLTYGSRWAKSCPSLKSPHLQTLYDVNKGIFVHQGLFFFFLQMRNFFSFYLKLNNIILFERSRSLKLGVAAHRCWSNRSSAVSVLMDFVMQCSVGGKWGMWTLIFAA